MGAALVALLLTATAADESTAIVREPPWSCWFGGRTITLRYRIAAPAAAERRASWSFSLYDRTAARREAVVPAAPGRAAILEFDVELPQNRPGVVIPASAALAIDAGPRLEHRLWIFPEDPFDERRSALAAMKIALFDPPQRTARLFTQWRVPFRPLRSMTELTGVEQGMVVIGEGLSFREWRTLPRTILETAARGVPVLCLAPADGEMPIPGMADVGTSRPTGMCFRQADIITAFDKRLDTAWPPDGRAAEHSIELLAGRSGMIGRSVSGDSGWPWLEFTFPTPRGRLTLCSLAIVARWDASPTPRQLLAHLLEYASSGKPLPGLVDPITNTGRQP